MGSFSQKPEFIQIPNYSKISQTFPYLSSVITIVSNDKGILSTILLVHNEI